MKKKVITNLASFAVLLAFSVLFLYVILPSQIKMSAAAAAEPFSPDTFPKLILTVLMIVSAVGIVVSMVQYLKIAKESPEGTTKEAIGKEKKQIWAEAVPFVIFLLCLAYAMLFERIGAIWSTVVVPPIVLRLMGEKRWKRYLILYAFAAVLYVLFKFVLAVPLR